MKKMMLVLLMMCLCCTASASMWTERDQEALEVTKVFRTLMTKEFNLLGLKVLSTGARQVISSKGDAVYLIYLEGEGGYYYYEIIFNNVNDNPELVEEYGIETLD